MWLGVLGPVRCTVDGRHVEVSGRLNRALLAALAVNRDRVTGVGELVVALWGDEPPPAAEKVVRNRVSVLRHLLTSNVVETIGAGYRLGRDVILDVTVFEDTAREATERLGLWRGAPFDGVREWPPASTASIRLGELRAHLEEVVVAEQLDRGVDPSSLVGTAEQLVQTEPFHERRWALLMRTLYLAGRQHDALRAFERARLLLRDELGLSPGSELLASSDSILNHEPSLGPHTTHALTAEPVHSALIGRDDEITAMRTSLAEQRFVTLVGLGGVGKTSLAHEVIAGCDVPCYMADLSMVDDPARVGETVARPSPDRRRDRPGARHTCVGVDGRPLPAGAGQLRARPRCRG